LLVKRVEAEEQRIGSIIIPDSAREKPQTAKVIAVGKGRVSDKGEVVPLDVKAGEYVLIGKYAGTEIKLDGEEFLIIREEEVLGVADGVPEAELAQV
jgi:chaperonin GroES